MWINETHHHTSFRAQKAPGLRRGIPFLLGRPEKEGIPRYARNDALAIYFVKVHYCVAYAAIASSINLLPSVANSSSASCGVN